LTVLFTRVNGLAQLLLDLAPPPAPSFDNFVAGRNAQALAALRSFGTGDEHCLYLWGAAGSGRTHLAHAWASPREAHYLDVSKPMPPNSAWEAAFAPALLAIDNCEALDEAGQIALFNAYNRARRGEAYLLITGSLPPMQLAIREDAKSRLAWGLSFEIVALDDDERLAALMQHATARGMKLGAGVLEYIAAHVRRDMPTLMALLDALDVASLRAKRPVTLPFVRDQLIPFHQPTLL
jgi:DnaA-homolog protein